MSGSTPSRNDPNADALRARSNRAEHAPTDAGQQAASDARPAKKRPDDNAPVGVDAQTVEQDVARYGALIANAESVVDQNVNTPLTVSRFGFVNALLRALFRRSE